MERSVRAFHRLCCRFLCVFRTSFSESFDDLSAGICKHFGKSVDSRTATSYNKNRPETIEDSGRFGVPDWIRTNGLSLRRYSKQSD